MKRDMRVRRATILDIPKLAKVDGGSKEAVLTFSAYTKLIHIEIHLSPGDKAYAFYERLHPGDRATAHLSGSLSGKEALKFMKESSDLFFKGNPTVEFLILTFPYSNRRLRYLGSKLKGVSFVGECGDNVMYVLNKEES